MQNKAVAMYQEDRRRTSPLRSDLRWQQKRNWEKKIVPSPQSRDFRRLRNIPLELTDSESLSARHVVGPRLPLGYRLVFQTECSALDSRPFRYCL